MILTFKALYPSAAGYARDIGYVDRGRAGR